MIEPAVVPRLEDVARHYDDLDPYYREIWGEHVHHGAWLRGDETAEEAVRALVDLVAATAAIGPGDAVTDIGCGYGATARVLAHEHGARVDGFTVSRAQFERARSFVSGANPTFHLRDWLENDLPDACRDAAVSIECLSHVADKRRFFAEVRRVLRPGGRGVLCAWLARQGAPAWQVRHLLEPICREGRLPGLATASEVLGLARGADFAEVELHDLTPFVKRTWPLCAGRLARRFLRDRELRRFARHGPPAAGAFARSVFRIWAAYELGAMRYGMFRLRVGR